MIKAKFTNGDLVFGLSGENIKRLTAGDPIMINLKDLGLEPRTMIIIYGETEENLYEQMKDHINDKTKLHL